MKKILLFVLIIGTLASCKKDEPKPPVLTAITLSKDTIKMDVGNTRNVSFTTNPSDYDKTKLTWKSSDNTIVSVSSAGAITAVKQGNAVITVTNQTATVTAVCLVTVLPELKNITLAKDTIKMNAGDVKTIAFTLAPTNYDKTALVWKSSDTTLLSVNKSGVITAKKEGDVIVSVNNQDSTITKFCLVSISPKIDNLSIGLIAYYPFNNSGVDVSGHGNNGTLFNISTVPDRHGNLNAAYHFDGNSSYISVPDKQELRLNNTDFTLNAWIKLDAYNTTSYLSAIMSKRFSGINNGWLWGINGALNIPNGAAYYGPGGGNADAIGNTVVNTGQWHMVTSVYSLANQQLSIYIDGVLDHTISNILTAGASTTALLYIGKDSQGTSGNFYYFQGAMDDIRIYKLALNPSAVQQLYNAPN